jgi:uncharacterized phage protein (TIGR02220 family)
MSDEIKMDQLVSDDMWVYGYTLIDNGVIYSKDITDSEFRTYCVVRSLVNQKKAIAWPSYDKIAELSGHSKRTAIRNVNSLIEKDLVQKITRSGTSNYFMVKKLQNSTVLRNEEEIMEWLEINDEKVNESKQPKQPEGNDDQKKTDPIPYKAIIEHLNEKTGKLFLYTTEKHRSLIRARYNELKKAGMDHHDIQKEFERVIDVKTHNWSGKFFQKNGKQIPAETYLQPSTLFGNKFDNYRNEDFEDRKQSPGSSAPQGSNDRKQQIMDLLGDD